MANQMERGVKEKKLTNAWFNELREIAGWLAGLSDCDRCGGLLVADRYVDLFDDQGHLSCVAMRCVQCGNILDPVILKNRRQVQAKQRELAGIA